MRCLKNFARRMGGLYLRLILKLQLRLYEESKVGVARSEGQQGGEQQPQCRHHHADAIRSMSSGVRWSEWLRLGLIMCRNKAQAKNTRVTDPDLIKYVRVCAGVS